LLNNAVDFGSFKAPCPCQGNDWRKLAFSLVSFAWSYLSAKLERLMKPRFHKNEPKIVFTTMSFNKAFSKKGVITNLLLMLTNCC
jgi:hypothetical protein